MASFSKASSWVSESSARIREVCVYGKGEPRHVLYFSTSQVVDFLQKSLDTVSFGCKMTARATIEVAAQIQSIQKLPTMEQRRLEDILGDATMYRCFIKCFQLNSRSPLARNALEGFKQSHGVNIWQIPDSTFLPVKRNVFSSDSKVFYASFLAHILLKISSSYKCGA